MTNLFGFSHFRMQIFVASAMALTSLSCAAALPSLIAVPGQPSSAAGFVTATQKSNGAKVVLRYKVAQAVSAGVATTVSLTFSDVTDTAASVRFTSDPGLRLLAAQAAVPLPLGSSEVDIQAVADSDGLFYLNVFTTQNGATSAISIPVAAGNAKPKLDAMGAPKPSAGGEKIISMPVR